MDKNSTDKNYLDTVAAITSTTGWNPKMRETHDRPLSLKQPGTLFFIIPASSLSTNAVIMGHFIPTNFGMVWSAMTQLVLFVLKLAFMQLNEIETPPGNYPIEVYLVPLRSDSNAIIEYMLVIDVAEDSPVKLDPLFIEAAKSPSKLCNIKGNLLDVTDDKRRASSIYRERKRQSEIPFETGKQKTSFDDYKCIDSIAMLDIVFGIYAHRKQSVSASEISASNVFTIVNAIKTMSPGVASRYRNIERYKKGGGEFGLPSDSVYYKIDSRFCSPDNFLSQFMPHLITSEYEKRFNVNLADLAKRSAAKNTAPVAEPDIAEEIRRAEEEQATLGGTRLYDIVAHSQRRVPDYAMGEEAQQALGLFRAQTAEIAHENHALLRLKSSMSQTKKIISDAFESGAISEEEKDQWMMEAKRSVIERYKRTCRHEYSEVSDVARAYRKFNTDKKADEMDIKLIVSDPSLSAMGNFKIYLMEVLSQYLGVAVHQPIIADIYVLCNSMFSENPAHVVLMGEGGAGKSFTIQQLFRMIGLFAVVETDSQSQGRRWISERHYYGIHFTDEMDPSSTVNSGNNQIGEAKAITSKGWVVREALARDEKTGERSIDKLLFVQKCMVIGLANKDESALMGSIKAAEEVSMGAFLSRFYTFNTPTVNHDLRGISHVRAGMNKKLTRPIDDVLNELIALHARTMDLRELIFIEVIEKPDLSQFHKCFPKFEEVMSHIKMRAGNNRQPIKIEQAVECHIVTRSFIEHYCIPGVSPYYGKQFTVESLLSMPLICTPEDVIMGCTMCYSMYMPRDVATVTQSIRKIVTDFIAQDGGEITFRNPNTGTGAAHASTFRAPERQQQQAGVNSGLLPRTDDRPRMDAYRNPQAAVQIPPPQSEERAAMYVCINGMSYEKLAKAVYNVACGSIIRPSKMSVKTCMNILNEMMISAPKHVWAPGEKRMPWPVPGETAVYSKPALDFSEHSAFVHVKLMEEDAGTFEDTWKAAVEAMFDESTIPRRALTSMTYYAHPFVARSIDIKPNPKVSSLMLNPQHLSESSSIALTGCYDYETSNPISRNEILEIKMDSDIYFAIQYYFKRNPRAAFAEAMNFATFNHPANRIALTKKAIEEQLTHGEAERNRRFIIYPDDKIDELEKLKTANDQIRLGKRPQGVDIVTSNDVLRQMCRREEDREIVEELVENQKEIMRKVADSASKTGATIDLDEFGEMMGIECREGERVRDLVSRALEKFNPRLYSQSILQNIEVEEEEEEEEEGEGENVVGGPPRVVRAEEGGEDDAAEREAFDDDDNNSNDEEGEGEEPEPIVEYPEAKRRKIDEDEDGEDDDDDDN